MRALAPLAALVCAGSALAPGLSARQGRVLRGEVLSRDGQPMPGVRLEVVDNPPEVHFLDGGRFVHNLVGSPSFVSLRVLSDSLTVLFPPGGRILLPEDPNAYVPIMVGPRIDRSVLNEVQSEMDRFRAVLLARRAPMPKRSTGPSASTSSTCARSWPTATSASCRWR